MISSDMRDQKIEKKRKQIEQQEKWIEHQLTYDIKKTTCFLNRHWSAMSSEKNEKQKPNDFGRVGLLYNHSFF